MRYFAMFMDLHGQVADWASIAGAGKTAVQAGFDSPGLFIIGQVAALGSSLNWFGESNLLKSAA
jgi:siroheme synthase